MAQRPAPAFSPPKISLALRTLVGTPHSGIVSSLNYRGAREPDALPRRPSTLKHSSTPVLRHCEMLDKSALSLSSEHQAQVMSTAFEVRLPE